MSNDDNPNYRTIIMGGGFDVPIQEGGSGPDEPVWYFDLKDQYNEAVATAAKLGLTITTGTAMRLPAGGMASDAMEFNEYAKLQAAGNDDYIVNEGHPQGARTVPHTVTQHYGMHCPACGLDDQLQVVASGWYGLTPDGLADTNDTKLEWDEQSPCRCGCGWTGVVKQAKIDESAAWPQGKPY